MSIVEQANCRFGCGRYGYNACTLPACINASENCDLCMINKEDHLEIMKSFLISLQYGLLGLHGMHMDPFDCINGRLSCILIFQ